MSTARPLTLDTLDRLVATVQRHDPRSVSLFVFLQHFRPPASVACLACYLGTDHDVVARYCGQSSSDCLAVTGRDAQA